MRTILFLILAANLCCLVAAQAGDIRGTVHAQGKEEAESEAAQGRYGSRKFKFAERIDYGEMHDFVVYIDGPLGTNSPAHTPVQSVTTRRIDQKGAAFSPHVLPVLVGTKVEWPNEDDILHNVFSISEPKLFDLGLYKHPVVKEITFDKPGRVDVFCSIHKAMNCIILVLENPYFSVTDAQGRYLISGVPAGTYKLKAWHERLPPSVRDLQVPEHGEVRVDFTLGILDLPKY